MKIESQSEVTPVTAFLDAADNLDMALDRIGALSLAIQERAEILGENYIVTLAHLAQELCEAAQRDADHMSEATKDLRERSEAQRPQESLLN